MQTGKGQVLELLLEEDCRHAWVACAAGLVPLPGQYVLAGDRSDAPLPVPLFHTDSASQGFIAAAPLPAAWRPGLELHLRGPLGRAFSLPPAARRVGLVAFEAAPARLRGLIRPALKQEAAVVLVCAGSPGNLPDEVEVQPLSALAEIVEWSDYVAFDVKRESLRQLRQAVGKPDPLAAGKPAQVLVQTPVPCGGLADCGICAVNGRSGWKLACKDGPVFDWRGIME